MKVEKHTAEALIAEASEATAALETQVRIDLSLYFVASLKSLSLQKQQLLTQMNETAAKNAELAVRLISSSSFSFFLSLSFFFFPCLWEGGGAAHQWRPSVETTRNREAARRTRPHPESQGD